jgi:uncharacterized membrane protein YqjE
LLAALSAIFVFWDTHRLLVSVLVTALFFGIAIVAGLVLRVKVGSKPRCGYTALSNAGRSRVRLTASKPDCIPLTES